MGCFGDLHLYPLLAASLLYRHKGVPIFILKPKDMINGKVMGIDNASSFFSLKKKY